ncbi:MAG: DUF5686 family protein [Prevotella sp.]
MNRTFIKLLLCISFLVTSLSVQAQIKGKVVDAEDNYGIPYATVTYQSKGRKVVCGADGSFTIQAPVGAKLIFSSVGYDKVTKPATSEEMVVALKASSQSLSEVTVKSKRKKYRRKNNPAVELMRRVIAAKKVTDLKNHDYFDYTKYQKLTFATMTKDSASSNRPEWWKSHLERSDFDEGWLLPLSVNETLTHHVYRKNPKKERDYILGQRSAGVSDIIQAGEILNDMLKEVFQDVNIYDDHVRLLQFPFPSPIGRTAISFYHFHIEDTVKVDGDSCFYLRFYPANQQDFGFSGDLYILKDSTLHVKRCVLNIPPKSDVNFVKSMRVVQEYRRIGDDWVLSTDDMWVDISVLKLFKDLYVTRKTRMDNYSFEPLARKYYRGKAASIETPDSRIRSDEYWAEQRRTPLTRSEADMDQFIHDFTKAKGYFWLRTLSQVFLENFVETGRKSKIDIGPLNTIISHNYIDNIRLRLSARTTANLNPHLFWKGFMGYGTKSNHWYWGHEFTYSFNKKQHSPFEFPMREITFTTEKDVMSFADNFLLNNKDNMMQSFRTQTVHDMFYYTRQKLQFVYETDWGMQFKAVAKAESQHPTGSLHYLPLVGEEKHKVRTTSLLASFDFLPNQTYVNTKQRRLPANYDTPEFNLMHTVGIKGFLGGQYNFNTTQLRLYKRQWMGSWGAIEMNLNLGAEWNKVPYFLLCMAPTNVSYFMERDNENFNLLRNEEFFVDRYAYWNISWDLNGKLFNRIPLLKHLKWREFFAIKGMWGHLTDKNNPLKHPDDPVLFQLPENSYVMSNKPYWECVVGIHNIFKFFAVNYVRRLTYNDHAHIDKWGIRFAFLVSF